jgi:hypothetical protein
MITHAKKEKKTQIGNVLRFSNKDLCLKRINADTTKPVHSNMFLRAIVCGIGQIAMSKNERKTTASEQRRVNGPVLGDMNSISNYL